MNRQLAIPIEISGCGWVTPVAVGNVTQTLPALADAQSARVPGCGAWRIPDDFRDGCTSLAPELKRDKTAWVAALAVEAACRDAAIPLDRLSGVRAGLVVGSALAGQAGMLTFANEVRDQSARFVSPIHFPQTVGNYVAGALARSYKIRGPNTTLACGTASGLAAVAEGCNILNRDEADIVVAGGVDTLSEELAAALGVAIEHPSEGACMFILRRADIVKEIDAPFQARVTAVSREASDSIPSPQHGSRDEVLSCDEAVAGAIHISAWTGHSFAALGAATLAAGIGTLSGVAVPVVQSLDPLEIVASGIGKRGGAETADGGDALGCVTVSASGSASEKITLSLEVVRA